MAIIGFFAAFLSPFVRFPAITPTEFERTGASFRVLVFFDIAVPTANPNDEIFVLVRGRINAQIEAGDFQLQHTVMNKRADSSGHVYRAPRDAPFGPDQFAALSQCWSAHQG
jgi:hypothetical protein